MTEGRLAGHAAIVTGASRGIGAAIAKRLAADGARVVVNYHGGSQAADEVAGAIRGAGGEAVTAQADVGDPGQVAEMFDRPESAFGTVTLLVNNAGRQDRTPFDELSPEKFDTVYATNARGPFLRIVEFARRVGSGGGRVVNVASGQARTPQPGTVLYAGTKGAVEATTRGFAADLGPRGVTVNAVAPGATATGTFEKTVPDDVKERTIESTALGRLGKPEDIADVVAFLLSKDARWVTGQVVDVSGGLRRG